MYASIVAKYHHLTEISGKQIDDAGLCSLGMMYNSTLTSIEFSEASLSNNSLIRICSGNPSLKKLLINSEENSEVTDEAVCSLAKCPMLECLSLLKWTKITDASINILSSLRCLKEINLSKCSSLTSAGVQSLLRSNRNLEVIILSDHISCSFCKFADGYLLSCIGDFCPRLREFEVDIDPSSTVVSDAAFIALFQGCPLLEKLVLWYKLFSDVSLCQLATYCPCLKTLALADGVYTDVGLIAVSSKCTDLTVLELRKSSSITDNSIISIAEHCLLNTLVLVGVPNVSDRGLCQVFKACAGLTCVTLDGLPLITDRSILTMIQSCPKVNDLTLSSNIGLTAKSLHGLIGLEGMGGIENLYFEECDYITDEAISILARYCSKLKTIILDDCSHVTAKSLISLLTHGKRLTYLELEDCNVELSQKKIDTYLARRPLARRLNVSLGDIGFFSL